VGCFVERMQDAFLALERGGLEPGQGAEQPLERLRSLGYVR